MKTIIRIWLAIIATAFCMTTGVRAEDTSRGSEPRTSVSVLGAVNKQGVVRLVDPTLVSAIAEGGGWTRLANLKQVAILRRGQDGKTEKTVVDFAAILDGKGTDPKLQKGDVIHVPERIH